MTKNSVPGGTIFPVWFRKLFFKHYLMSNFIYLFIYFRDEALGLVEQQVKNMEMKLSSAISIHRSEKEIWEKNLQNVEETWQCN